MILPKLKFEDLVIRPDNDPLRTKTDASGKKIGGIGNMSCDPQAVRARERYSQDEEYRAARKEYVRRYRAKKKMEAGHGN